MFIEREGAVRSGVAFLGDPTRFVFVFWGANGGGPGEMTKCWLAS